MRQSAFQAPHAPHRIAASALLVGGALAFTATFLPLGQTAYVATEHDPATTIAEIPAHDLITAIQFNVQYPQESSIGGTCFWGFVLWGAPLVVVAIGLSLLLARRWIPPAGSLIACLALILLGVGYNIISCSFYLHPFFGSQGATRTLEYGADLAFLGYFVALVGIIWLAFQRGGRTSRAHTTMELTR